MEAQLKVELVEPDADSEAVDELVTNLRLELLELDVDAVSRASAGPAPAGSKGVELAAAAALIVQLKGSVDAVAAVVSRVRSWLNRDAPAGRTLKITLQGSTIELSAATADQQEHLVEEFLRAVAASDT